MLAYRCTLYKLNRTYFVGRGSLYSQSTLSRLQRPPSTPSQPVITCVHNRGHLHFGRSSSHLLFLGSQSPVSRRILAGMDARFRLPEIWVPYLLRHV